MNESIVVLNVGGDGSSLLGVDAGDLLETHGGKWSSSRMKKGDGGRKVERGVEVGRKSDDRRELWMTGIDVKDELVIYRLTSNARCWWE